MRAILAVAAALAGSARLSLAQEQVHLSVTGVETEMHVSWVEVGGKCSSSGSVSYSASRLATADATGTLYEEGMTDPICLWEATMTGLTRNTRYNYTLSNSDSGSGFSGYFTSLPNNQRQGGKMYAVYGDLGLDNDISLAQIVSEAKSGVYDMVIHSGDFA
jgi:hypothetical protein